MAIAAGGTKVPAPVPSASGEMLQIVDGVQVDVLTWLRGDTVARAMSEADAKAREALFHDIGQQMARLHETSDAWPLPEGFERCAWNRAGLVGETPLWGRFWANPALTGNERTFFIRFRDTANAVLSEAKDDLDYGLIHADLVSANMMVDDDQIHFIDFDDGGFGFRIFDIATALLKHLAEPDYPALMAALIAGYRSVRPLNLDLLDLFLALRAATYVGWNISRMGEEGATSRNARFISDARGVVGDYLATHRV